MDAVWPIFWSKAWKLSDHQLQEMLFRANAAASLETTRKGAIRAMPTQAELEDYLKQLTSF